MIQSLNFPISKYSIAPYGSWDSLAGQICSMGLDGIEGILDPDDMDPSFPHSLLTGYHLTFYPDWLDFYRQNTSELIRKFGSMETVRRFYRGTKPEDLMKQFRDDLAYAVSLGTPYVVFHVSDVSLEETYTYRWLHTDEEVIDGAVEFINELLRDVEPSFDFLVENQWWPGFTFTEPEKTEHLLSGIRYPRVGIMLDTGHLMNCNRRIRTQAQGTEYILDMIRSHGELSERIFGMHFHQSISGSYVRKNTGKVPDDLPEDYFEAFAVQYSHIQMIDRHRPWTYPGCVRIINEVGPKYLTHELSSGPGRPQLTAARRQLSAIRKGRNGVII